MRHLNMAMLAGIVLFAVVIAGCGSSPVAINPEATTSAIRAAEEGGAASISSASLYLQLSKEELVNAKRLAAKGNKVEAESMLKRAQVDGELALALTRSDTATRESVQAEERVRKLRIENKLPEERK